MKYLQTREEEEEEEDKWSRDLYFVTCTVTHELNMLVIIYSTRVSLAL